MKEVIIYFHDREPITFEIEDNVEGIDMFYWTKIMYPTAKYLEVKDNYERKRI